MSSSIFFVESPKNSARNSLKKYNWQLIFIIFLKKRVINHYWNFWAQLPRLQTTKCFIWSTDFFLSFWQKNELDKKLDFSINLMKKFYLQTKQCIGFVFYQMINKIKLFINVIKTILPQKSVIWIEQDQESMQRNSYCN